MKGILKYALALAAITAAAATQPSAASAAATAYCGGSVCGYGCPSIAFGDNVCAQVYGVQCWISICSPGDQCFTCQGHMT